MAATLSTRLETTARALAYLWSNGQLTAAQLRDQMARAIAEAQTIALLTGTNGQRNAEIDAALRDIIASDTAELDRLMTLIEREPQTDVERRLLAFADTLDHTRSEGQRLVERRGVSPLVPIAVGTGLGALINRLGQQPAPTNQQLPRIDSRSLQSVADNLGNRLDALAEQLANGDLTADQWHEAMGNEIRIIHQTYARLGGGDVNAQRLQDQLDYLQGFRGDVEGKSLAYIKQRARMYIGSGQASLQEAATARIGLPVLPSYPKSGETSCLGNCRCFWDIQPLDGNGNWDCFWRLRPAEHCDECVARANLWSPIQIRNGVIQPYQTVGVFA